jgi:menaquinol-cytochrome c reductase iron-sulfur subunit
MLTESILASFMPFMISIVQDCPESAAIHVRHDSCGNALQQTHDETFRRLTGRRGCCSKMSFRCLRKDQATFGQEFDPVSPENPVEGTVLDPRRMDRRRFLSLIAVGFGGLAGAIASVPFLGFILAPMRERQPEQWFPVGDADQFRIGETVKVAIPDGASVPWSGRAGESAIWLRRSDEDIYSAYSIFCTHLGCPVLWLPQARLFMCPCHGGTFHENGIVASGPPDRPLDEFPVRVEDGQVQIRTRGIEIG